MKKKEPVILKSHSEVSYRIFHKNSYSIRNERIGNNWLKIIFVMNVRLTTMLKLKTKQSALK